MSRMSATVTADDFPDCRLTVSEPGDTATAIMTRSGLDRTTRTITLQSPVSAATTVNPGYSNNNRYDSKAECTIIKEEKQATFYGLVRSAIQRQEHELTGLTSTTIEAIDSLLRDSPMPVAIKVRHCFYRTSVVQLKAEDREAAKEFLKNQEKIKTAAVEKEKLPSPYYDYYKSSASESEDQIQVEEALRQRQRRHRRLRGVRFGNKTFITNNPRRRSDKSLSEIYAQVLNYIRKTSLQSHASGDCLEMCKSQTSQSSLSQEIPVLNETNRVVSPGGDTVSPQSSSSGNDSGIGFGHGHGHGHRIRVRVRETAIQNSLAKDLVPEADLSEKHHPTDLIPF